MRKILLILVAVCAIPAGLDAQQTGWIARTFRQVTKSLTTPNRILDTNYVYQLETPWVVSANADLIWTGIHLNRDITLADSPEKTDFVHIDNHLHRELFKKVGGGFSYGSLSVNYTTEVDRHGTKRNKYLNLGFFRPRFGINVQYYSVDEFLDGVIRMDWLPDFTTETQSDAPGLMRQLVVDAFYFFNPERFSYSTVSSRNFVQSRSAGSWVASASYSQGEYKYMLEDGVVLEFYDHVGRIRTGIFSVGGGYSFNWVLFHSAPGGRSVKGLRNLTLNLTATPRVSLYDHLFTTVYNYPDPEPFIQKYKEEHGEDVDEKELDAAVFKYQLDGVREGEQSQRHEFFRPSLDIAARAALSFSWDRFQLCANATLNRFSFRDIKTVNKDPLHPQDIQSISRGSFYDISTRIQFSMRF